MADMKRKTLVKVNSSIQEPNTEATQFDIKSMIRVVRNQQVMIGSDLAILYQVETKRLNEVMKRNIARSPEEFRPQLTVEETESLRSQFATLDKNDSRRRHRKYLPCVSTEQGVAMLSAVLRGDVVVQVSIGIMKPFVEMRRFIASNALLFERVSTVELWQLEYQKQTNEKLEWIFEYIFEHEESSQEAFSDGQIYDAFSLIMNSIQKAEIEIILIDGYVDIETLNPSSERKLDAAATIYTQKQTKLTKADVKNFNAQHPTLKIRYTKVFHDRFLILDQATTYHVGASLKDAGRKCFGIDLIQDVGIIKDILQGSELEAEE